jgi:hypothetical protein
MEGRKEGRMSRKDIMEERDDIKEGREDGQDKYQGMTQGRKDIKEGWVSRKEGRISRIYMQTYIHT